MNVKGSALASRVLWVQLGHGAAGHDRLLAQSSPALRASLEHGIDKARWYPLEQFVELNETIDRLWGAGDGTLIRALGRHAADATLTTIYRLFYKVGTTQWILGRAARLWTAYYDSGGLEVLTGGAGRAVLRIRGFETPHPVHCAAVAGWCERSVELSGGKAVTVVENVCRTRGGDYCELEARWR